MNKTEARDWLNQYDLAKAEGRLKPCKKGHDACSHTAGDNCLIDIINVLCIQPPDKKSRKLDK